MTARAAAAEMTERDAWGLSAPATALAVALTIVPVALLLWQAFVSPESGELTLANFADLWQSNLAVQAFWRTLRVAVITTALCVLGGYPLAVMIARAGPRAGGLFLAIVIFPLMVSVVVRAFGWMVILGPSGIVNSALQGLGLVSEPLQLVRNEIGIVIGETQLLLPYMVLSLLAVLRRGDPHVEEAALSLGANPVVTFLRVTLPTTLPGLLSGVLLVFSLAMTAFATPLILGGARTPLLTTLLYRYVFSTYDWSAAAAVAAVLGALALAFVTLHRLLTRYWMRHG